jgi:hypothetical protein
LEDDLKALGGGSLASVLQQSRDIVDADHLAEAAASAALPVATSSTFRPGRGSTASQSSSDMITNLVPAS